MCIRDRNLSDAHREAKEEMKTELRRLAEQDVLRRYDQVRGLRPVSYTHLDVYKRQVRLCILRMMIPDFRSYREII